MTIETSMELRSDGIALVAETLNGTKVIVSTCFASARAARLWASEHQPYIRRLTRATQRKGKALSWRERMHLALGR